MNTGYIYRLTDYCLVEYVFVDPQNPQTPINADFTVLTNKYNNEIQFYNDNSNTTNNIQDYTVVQTDGNTYVYIDEEKVPNYLDYDKNFIKSTPSTDAFGYDIVRFHFVSGFSFNAFEALIFTIKNLLNNGNKGIFANILIDATIMQNIINLNPHPLFVGDAFFDRYFEIQIPAIKKMNRDYYTSQTPDQTLAAKLSPGLNETETAHEGYIGYVTDAPISISLSESNTYRPYTPVITTYDTYIINLQKTLSLVQTNDFDGLTAEIHESEEGNYIEYSLLKYGAFPNEFISYLNGKESHNNWIIIHQLSVYEHVGSTEIKTSDMMYYQGDNFEEYLKYRPVLEYANDSIAFSIEYLIRLTNQKDGEQIIRRGSATFDNPKAYGKDTRALMANVTAQPYNIYNKIILKKGLDKTESYIEPEFNDVPQPPITAKDETIMYQKQYVPYVINFAKVGLGNQSVFNKSVSLDNFIYGQGKYPLTITPMDNFFKFIIYEEDINGVYKPIDLNIGTRYNLVFRTGNKEVQLKDSKSKVTTPEQSKVIGKSTTIKEQDANIISPLGINTTRSSEYIQTTTSTTTESSIIGSDNIRELTNLKEGELLFRLTKKEAKDLYNSKSDEFYITIVSEDGAETVLYRGLWFKMSEFKKVEKQEKEAILDPRVIPVKADISKDIQIDGASPVVSTGAYKDTEFDPETNIVVSDNPLVEVPDYISLYDNNNNKSVVLKLIPKAVIEEKESDVSSSTISDKTT